MIVDALLDLLQGFLWWLGGLLPQWDAGAVFDNWGLVTANLSALNYFLPISELFAFTLSIVYVLPFFLAASGALWLAAFIRGGNSRG